MIHWENYAGMKINWFSSKLYESNVKRQTLLFRTFEDYGDIENLYSFPRPCYAATEALDLTSYVNNFTNKVSKEQILYFDKSSKFPRVKATNFGYKRCINPNKANLIVLANSAQVKVSCNAYCVFLANSTIYAIALSDFERFFKSSLEKIVLDKYIGNKIQGTPKELYCGKLQFIFDPTDTIYNFQKGIYKQKFILDTDLDAVINQYLPNPTLNDIVTIDKMIKSNDKDTIRLALLTAASFNVTKWPLTFRLLFTRSKDWTTSEYGGKLSMVVQMIRSLKLCGGWSLYTTVNLISGLKETYSEEDISLAKDFARTLPEVKHFCKGKDLFYLEQIPFIPDEYKK